MLFSIVIIYQSLHVGYYYSSLIYSLIHPPNNKYFYLYFQGYNFVFLVLIIYSKITPEFHILGNLI